MVIIMEVCKGPMSFDEAEDELVRLMDETNAFHNGSFPVVGRLKTSYGYKKIIGVQSFDHKVRTRLDFDSDKGYHFNFINDNTGEKICVLINDMNESQYRRYIDGLTVGKSPIILPKRKVVYSIIDPNHYNDPSAYQPVGYPSEANPFILAYLEELKKIELEEMQEEQESSEEFSRQL